MLKKLDREIERLRKAMEDQDGQLEAGDSAINGMLTAWHICDWFMADLVDRHLKETGSGERASDQAEYEKQCESALEIFFPDISKCYLNGKKIKEPLNQLQREMKKRCQDGSLGICDLIANKSKHAQLDVQRCGRENRDVPTTVTNNAAPELTSNLASKVHWEPNIIMNGELKKLKPAIDVLLDAQNFWKKELAQHF